jgi:hypothetical protein
MAVLEAHVIHPNRLIELELGFDRALIFELIRAVGFRNRH